jgi:hypothetical protein
LKIQSEEYGYYHDRELAQGEQGFDIISTWFDNLLEVCLLVETTEYVALKDIESFNTWLEFLPIEKNQLSISLMESNDFTSDFIILQPLMNRNYPSWRNILITKEEFGVTDRKFTFELILFDTLENR